MRKIPKKTREKALELWLKGHKYREISNKLHISLGTINEIIEEARQKEPEIDELKRLNLMLKKTDLDLYEALRGANLRKQINKIDVTPDLLEKFIELSKKLSYELDVNPNDYATSAIRLMNLEQNTNKSYETILKQYGESQSENAQLQEENQQLKNQIMSQKEKLKKIKKEHQTETSKIKNLVTTQKRLERIGLDKLEKLAKFIEEYETLGFNAENVQELYLLDRKLLELNITSKNLMEYIQSETAYKKKISNLKKETEKLRTQISNQITLKNNLLEQNQSLKAVDNLLRKKRITITCKNCHVPISRKIGSRADYINLLNNHRILISECLICGYVDQIHPNEELAQIALKILPKDEDIIEI